MRTRNKVVEKKTKESKKRRKDQAVDYQGAIKIHLAARAGGGVRLHPGPFCPSH